MSAATRCCSPAAIRLDGLIATQATNGQWAALIGRLRRLRGIDTLTAVGLLAEIGDFAPSIIHVDWRASSDSCPQKAPPVTDAARARSRNRAQVTPDDC
jgi:hypothetical protein